MKTAKFSKDADGTLRVVLFKRQDTPASPEAEKKKPDPKARAAAILRAFVSRCLELIRLRTDNIGTASEAAASVLRSDWGKARARQFEDLTGGTLSAGRLARLVAEQLATK